MCISYVDHNLSKSFLGIGRIADLIKEKRQMNKIRDGRWGRRRPYTLPNSRFDDHQTQRMILVYKSEGRSEVKKQKAGER